VVAVVAAVISAAVGLGLVLFVRAAAPVGTALAAKQLCSLAYVSGLDRGFARAACVDPHIRQLSMGLDVRYDDTTRSVETTGFRLWSARARYRPGLGCTLLHADARFEDLALPRVAAAPISADPDHARTRFDAAALERALDAAFADPPGESPRHTLAVVVLHEGRLVAERYAAGFDETTALPGWSMAKSVTATLVGVLVHQNRLDVDAAGAIVEWRDSDDPRSAITVDHLLRMTSGLAIREDQSGADPNSRMLFLEPDGAAYSAQRSLRAEPGTHWEYMSGNTVLASRRIRELTGGSLKSVSVFFRTQLFEPLGMATAVLEPDPSGTPVGSSFMLASARDWARLGQLYLNGGRWNGRRIFSASWVDYVTRHTPTSGEENYGAGFWINDAPEGPRWPTLPRDTYAASGFQHQRIFIAPSHQLVVVRLGATWGDRSHLERLAADVIAARRCPAPSDSHRVAAAADAGGRPSNPPRRQPLAPYTFPDAAGSPPGIPPKPIRDRQVGARARAPAPGSRGVAGSPGSVRSFGWA
jgi:CubicO group peptidase (beta-lactamase class C family)